MSLHQPVGPMTIDDFLEFTDARSGDERWELIDGEAVMNPSPSYNHQIIADNLLVELKTLQRGSTKWQAISGFGVSLSGTSMPVPDVLIRPRRRVSGHFCDDMTVAFEVLSPSSRSMDLRWKRQAYPQLSTLQHYVVLAQDEVAARCFDRATGWTERLIEGVEGEIALQAVDLRLQLDAIYADTGL